MADDDVSVIPTQSRPSRATRRSVEATYHETQTRRGQTAAQRPVESTETAASDQSSDHTARHRFSRTTVGVTAFLLAAATLLYGVTVGLDSIRHTLDGTVLDPLLDSASLVVTIEIARTATTALLVLGGLCAVSMVGRAAFLAVARS